MKKNQLRHLSNEAINFPSLKYVQAENISLKNHPQFNEMWLQDRIYADPTILGLGNISVIQRERLQPRSGRLDLLLKEVSSGRRFTLELQLGVVDESHIIRSVEYWDNERKRNPQFEHCAVICAETINSRFLNVISLFNGQIPMIALQVKAIKIEDKIALNFTKVLDEVELQSSTEEENIPEASREYWEQKSSVEGLQQVDSLANIIRQRVGAFDLKYNKYYIGCIVKGRAANFISFKPQRSGLRLDIGNHLSDEEITCLEEAGIEVGDYTHHWRVHPVRLTPNQAQNPPEELLQVIQRSFKEYFE